MFHVNEAKNGCGELTVKDGKMSIHISLVSQKIVNLYVGTAADAAKDGAGGIEELLHCMEGIVLLNEERLIDYLARYDAHSVSITEQLYEPTLHQGCFVEIQRKDCGNWRGCTHS